MRLESILNGFKTVKKALAITGLAAVMSIYSSKASATNFNPPS